MTAGTTNTGLDEAVDIILNDYGLTSRISGADLREGAAAADGMNGHIVAAIRATGVANDGTLTTSDVYTLNSYIRGHNLASWTALHGDDEGDAETGFHQVQGDGAAARLFGQAAVDTILDSLYHLGFEIDGGRFVNEDGNANASVEDVAYWLSELLEAELAAGTLASDRADPQVHGTTGTGLDLVTETIVDDPGLNANISQHQINVGAAAADAMNALIVEGIRAAGIADDGDITAIDLIDLNHWIKIHHQAEWIALHGDDEDGKETGLHLVQGDGGRSYLYGHEAVDTVADGLYHLGFDIQWGRFLNEDGNANALVSQVAEWLTLLLQNDLADGRLDSGHAAVDAASLLDDVAYRRAATVTDDGSSGAVDVGRQGELRLAKGTIALTFTANAPDDGDYHVLFSKDGSSNAAGDVTAFVHNGHLTVLLQDGKADHWLEIDDYAIEAGQSYDFAMSFGPGGLQIYLNGEKVAAEYDLKTGLAGNNRSLVIGGGAWGRDSSHPDAIWHHLDGTVSGLTVYDRALTRKEVQAISSSGPLPQIHAGDPVRDGAQPAVLAGTGLVGEVYDRTGNFGSIDDLIAQTVTDTAAHQFTASRIDFGGNGESDSLGEFLDDAGALTGGGANTPMTTIGLHLQSCIWIGPGTHLVTVRSDDGYLLSLGGNVISSYARDRGFESTSQQITLSGGLYAIDLYYYQNLGADGLRLEIDGKVVTADAFFATPDDYDAALAANGEMPPGGIDQSYDGPVGTTGTGLDALIQVIGEDEGLARSISHGQLLEGAKAADDINKMIVEAIDATGAWDDEHLTVSEVYDLSDYIRTHYKAAFIVAHGNDENGVETAFHLLQGDGGTSYLFGEDAVDTVLDGIYHIGFQTIGDRFANEDGNANARVETVAYWLNELLSADPFGSPGSGPGSGVGSADHPNVVEDKALNTRLASGALNLTLTGTAGNGKGNALANRLAGNDYANSLDGGDGNDLLVGNGGADSLIGGRGVDTMRGGEGDDSYFVDTKADTIVETASNSGGRDSIFSEGGLSRYALTSGLEDLTYLGNADFDATGNQAANLMVTGEGDDALDGAGGNDELHAGGGSDRLVGGAGNDHLNGGKGTDRMLGGTGNDGYVVDHKNDVVVEASGEGNDSVFSAISYTLGATLENLVLVGGGNFEARGNALDNDLFGNLGRNLLDGRGGVDRMEGEGGNDTYIVDNAGDRVIEKEAGGHDLVRASVSVSLGRYVEDAVLLGSANLSATGSAADNTLQGNTGRNVLVGLGGEDELRGREGDDLLLGGGGADSLTGGDGADKFVFAELSQSTPGNRDVILDFSRAEGDKIDLRGIDAVEAGANSAFHWVRALSGHKGELAVSALGARRLVEGDVDGDGVADFALLVANTDQLQQRDFLM